MNKINILRNIRDYLIENSNFAVSDDDIEEIDSWIEVLNELIGLEERINKLEEIADEFRTQEFLNHEELMEAIDALVGWNKGTEA